MSAPITVRRATQRGASIVELMVGTAVGLVVSAGALAALGLQDVDQRRVLLDTQLQQDLRHAGDLVARELRRSAYWGAAAQGLGGAVRNPYATLTADRAPSYSYSRSAVENGQVDSEDQAGFRLRAGTLEMLVGGAGWQALTDVNVLNVTRFDVQWRDDTVALPCERTCAAGDAACAAAWPRLHRRLATVWLGGRAVHDARVERLISTQVALRNDTLDGRCPG